MPSKCPIKRREQRKRWRLANPDKVHKSSQDWNARNLENKRAGSRAWANANPERSGAWIKAHPEYYQQYRKLHPDKGKANTHNRRARKRGNGGTFTAAQWVALQVLHGCRCLCCGRDERVLQLLGLKLVPDHVRPLVKGGSNDIGNIQPLCHGRGGCNLHKSTKHIDYRPGFPPRGGLTY